MTTTATQLMTWMTAREVARRLDCSTANVHSRIRQGRIVATKTRFGWLIDPESVSAYERSRRQKCA